jgi:hypothetical protein
VGGQLLVYIIIGRKSVLVNHFISALLRQLQTAQKDSKANPSRAIDTPNLTLFTIILCDYSHFPEDSLFRRKLFYFPQKL